ncbi:MAG: outer membrane protein OmpA-like peptidoglycan-associated protein [Parvicellaceae bacterium]|jgi:outer membrane protein OmpA-like peptidoglycan-associated protein
MYEGCKLGKFETIMTKAFIFLSFIFSITLCVGQNNECFTPVEISIPFNKKSNLVETHGKENYSNLNKVLFLQSDEYSFWYKVRSKHKTEISIDLYSTSIKDTHDILIFKYQDTSFCKDVVYGDYPVSGYGTPDFMKSEIQHLTLGKTELEANVDYYISVVAYDDFDCGHVLKIGHKRNTLKINAIHRSCFQFLAEEPTKDSTVIKEEIKFNPEIEINGQLISNEANNHIDGTIEFLDLSSGEHFEAKVSTNKGYRVQLKKGAKYLVNGNSKYHFQTDSTIVFAEPGTFDLTLKKLGKGDAVVFNNIYFHPNIYKIKSTSSEGLNELLTFMRENESFRIEVQGHTAGNTSVKRFDPRYQGKGKDWQFKGSAQKLSKLRAEEVKLFLIENGIQNNRIKALGYGASKKIYPNPESEDENRLNMRVEILILSD